MVMLYFSGTGNSKYIAELFCRYMNIKCYSIENNIDFCQLLTAAEIIGFCYPIYGSRVPRIMREFVERHKDFLKNKKLFIFCSQLIFSGDGARSFTDIFPKNWIEIIYAEHFFMPNNVCNLPLLPLASEIKIKKYMVKADQKMKDVCQNITDGIIKRRGFNIISKKLGQIQGTFMPAIEKKAMKSVFINDNCNKCLLCVSICPMKNFDYQNKQIIHKNNCTICYRCINKCPNKAITVFINNKTRKQYNGLSKYILKV